MKLRRVVRIALWIVLVMACLCAGVLLTGWLALRASLADLDGEVRVAGMQGRVSVERDALGVPTIVATNRVDATRALGFLHAQERFFQMDLARRAGAGELSELFGAVATGRDINQRVHRPRARVRGILEGASREDAALLRAYSEGVNAGLAALGSRPPEYWLLRQSPVLWRDEDTYLVAIAMFDDLHDITGRQDYMQHVMERVFSPKGLKFFAARDSTWSAALDGSVLPAPAVPGPRDVVLKGPGLAHADAADTAPIKGSNNWAVEGARSATGSAIVANDMHLGLSVPNTWFRARIVYWDAANRVDVTGVTLPGTPVVVSGSNGRVAWANTASHLDVADLVELELDPANTNRYRIVEGWKDFELHQEAIRVRGSTNLTVTVRETVWGPVVRHGDRDYALLCTFHRPGGLNMGLVSFETAQDARSLLGLAKVAGTPLNNLVVGDRQGDIGFTLMGRIPQRVGFTGEKPAAWNGSPHWDGWRPPREYPEVFKPAGGVILTANNRLLGTPQYASLPVTGQDIGARARQIRDTLVRTNSWTQEAMWEIYADDRAIFYARWQELLMRVLQDKQSEDCRKLREAVSTWGERASIDSPGFLQVRLFRDAVMYRLFEPVNTELARIDGGARLLSEEATWIWLADRPAHLLSVRFKTYDALLEDAMREVLKRAPAGVVYGDVNRAGIQHPLSRAVPILSRWLDMADAPVSGGHNMPKVHSPGFGVSQRMIVSPGHEASGLYNMPGGQSGHFLSPFYRSEMESWLSIRPEPFLPGVKKHRLVLTPSATTKP